MSADDLGFGLAGLQIRRDHGALCDHLVYGVLDAGCGIGLAEVAQHQGTGQDGGDGIRFVLPGDVRRGAVDGLKDGQVIADIGAGDDAQAADQAGAQVAYDVAIEIGEDQHVVGFRLEGELHAHVVDDQVLEADVGIALGDLAGDLQEEAVGHLEDIGFVHGRHLVATITPRIVEGIAHHAFRCLPCDDADRLGGLVGDHLVLNADVEALGVLPDDDHVDAGTRARQPRHGAGRPDIGVEVECFADGHVDAAEPGADWGRNGALEGDPGGSNGIQHRYRQRGTCCFHHAGAGVMNIPREGHSSSFKHPTCGTGDFGADAISGDECNRVGLGHCLTLLPTGYS